MRAVVQRVTRASVEVDGVQVGSIERGILVFLGVERDDTDQIADRMASKVGGLRIFEDGQGKMNLSAMDVGGDVLAVSQFTLGADVSRGRRPSFTRAAPPGLALPLYEHFCAALRRLGYRVETGVFGAHMAVSLLNEGPLTLIVNSSDLSG